ncbi:kinesin-like protein KIF23 [Uloborus diversus]|uniref:kinesin-like protein KIF23 n=1 Tax=Uloborus diversus TaxID=327109 RepID=UPI00240919D0|nr:kinesin-like protein KIF23 [Uloborus diversus]
MAAPPTSSALIRTISRSTFHFSVLKQRERNQTPKSTTKNTRTANKVKSVKDPIEVYCRIRPLENEFDQPCVKAKDEKTVILSDISQNTRTIKEVHHSFKRVFDGSTTQKELFDYVALPLVQDLISGQNGLLFTYGITSSGKTYTMTGSPQDGGLLPRSLDAIFNSISDYQAKKYVFKSDTRSNCIYIQSTAEALLEQQKNLGVFSNKTPKHKNKIIGDGPTRVPDPAVVDVNPDVNYAVFVSYVEIYNNYIYDLLEDAAADSRRPNLTKVLRADNSSNMYICDVIETEVKSVDEALELLHKGQQRRRVASTHLNAESSRSHSVFTIRLVQAPLDPIGAEVLQDKDQMIISQLSLVDLAGSERGKRTKNQGLATREAGNINNSLMVLRNCMELLRAESQGRGTGQMIPYRESKLTFLFKTFLEGEGKIRMVVCVNPAADNFEETTHVMKFAEMTQDVLISRPTPVSTPTAITLKQGRGNLYKEAVRRAQEQGVSVMEVLAPAVYSLGPDFPQLIQSFEDESVYINLIEFLLARATRRNMFVQDLHRRQKILIAIDKENVQLKQEKAILQMDLNAREQQVRSLERKLSASDQSVERLEKKLSDLETEKENAIAELNHKAKTLSEQSKEVERVKNKMQEKLASEKDRLRRIMERRLAEKQAELERKMCFTDEKFRQLREILNADDWDYFDVAVALPAATVPSTATSEASVPEGKVTRKATATSNSAGEPSVEPRFTKVKSAVDFFNGGSNRQTPSAGPSSRNNHDSIFSKENRTPSTTPRPPAVANPRHRRSHSSSGDVWIEHKPIGNLELNTVLQPAMKKKKSVSKLEVKDVTKSDVSKYVLQHQEQDSQGEVETQLYKADVIPSAGGGAQVIFNDVEKLKQVSPPPVYNLRKRSSENLPLREIENRCTVSVECHGLPSKIMKKN